MNNIATVIVREMKQMVGLFVYLLCIFSAFILYRSLVLAQEGIDYSDYGFAFIKALVFAKVILIIKFVSFVTLFDDKPLIIPTTYKVLLFSVLSFAFAYLEHVARALIKGYTIPDALGAMFEIGPHELSARMLTFVLALIPYFVINEITRIVGKGVVLRWFYKGVDPSFPRGGKD